MILPLYQVDAFADRLFEGNPAAVCPLEHWLDDDLLQAVAAENNLSETAYLVREGDEYRLRWFTPTVEVDLCGHATLAAAWIAATELGDESAELRFQTRSGLLSVRRQGDLLAMDFPAAPPSDCPPDPRLLSALGLSGAVATLTSFDQIVVVEHEDEVLSLSPDFAKLKGLPGRGVAVTAPGRDVDFVSRWFGPNVGVDEDPVTGSAHTFLAPYWAGRLGKSDLTARQGGPRKGSLRCVVRGDRVELWGRAITYLRGAISLPTP